MKLKTTLCWMLVTLLLLSFAQAEEPLAVRVGDVSYSPEDGAVFLPIRAGLLCRHGIELSQADGSSWRRIRLTTFIGLGLIENKLARQVRTSSRRNKRKACVPMPKTCMRAYGRACIRN